MTTPTDATALVARVRSGLAVIDAKLDYPDARGPDGPVVQVRCSLLADLATAVREVLSLVAQGEADREPRAYISEVLWQKSFDDPGTWVHDGLWLSRDELDAHLKRHEYGEGYYRIIPLIAARATPTEGPTHG